MLGAEAFLADLLPEVGIEAAANQALDDACVLMHVVAAADRVACPMSLWPRQVGPDAGEVGRAVLRANLVADIAAAAAGPGAAGRLAIDLPLVDMADDRLVELAEEGGAPMRAFWPCDSGGSPPGHPCRQCEGCRRWTSAFERAGSPWPWTAVAI